MVKTHLHRFARTFAPALFHWYRSHQLRQHFRAHFGADQRRFRETFYPANTLPTVLSGPFQGMVYIDETVWGPITPKWAGTYEIEIEDIIKKVLQTGYDRFVNLGCAEGYYAVGIALKARDVEIYAFDVDPFSRRQVHRLAKLNRTSDRILVFGECTHDRLNKLISGKALVLADIEGDEAVLLDPDKVPKLKEADLLIEVHETGASINGMTDEEKLTRRFAPSHMIDRRVSTGRECWIDQHRQLWQNRFSRAQMAKALDEARLGQQVWLWAQKGTLPPPKQVVRQ
jgi:hypothetical protein